MLRLTLILSLLAAPVLAQDPGAAAREAQDEEQDPEHRGEEAEKAGKMFKFENNRTEDILVDFIEDRLM